MRIVAMFKAKELDRMHRQFLLPDFPDGMQGSTK